ncbi:MAG: DUF2249 domain-containing protein [Pseudomonadota bacterium]|nr:MAG: DUF2249 domain-containing protein [Pseudomonadota bacterium]
MTEQTPLDAPIQAGGTFDARGLDRRFRHPAIFAALQTLQPGETMRFVNDHDPLPLLNQLNGHFGDALSIEYRLNEPGVVVLDMQRVS